MRDGRRFLLAVPAVRVASSRRADGGDDAARHGRPRRLGAFERVPGRPGIVVGVPHGTPDRRAARVRHPAYGPTV